MRKLSILLLMVAFLLPAYRVAAQEDDSCTGWAVLDVWARPSTPAGMSAAYGYIVNLGHEEDVLLEASSDVAEAVEIHTMTIGEDDVMTMQPVEGGLHIPARGFVQLKPGGYHLMLINLTVGLEAGQTFEIDLNFENAGTLTITALVADPDAMPMDMSDHSETGSVDESAAMPMMQGHGHMGGMHGHNMMSMMHEDGEMPMMQGHGHMGGMHGHDMMAMDHSDHDMSAMSGDAMTTMDHSSHVMPATQGDMPMSSPMGLNTFATEGCNGVVMVGGWARPNMGPNSAAYGLLLNPTDEEIVVTGGSSEVVEAVELHTMTVDENDVMIMGPLEGGLVIPAQGFALLNVGGTHLMLINVSGMLEVGGTLDLTLALENGDTIPLTLPILDPEAEEAAEMDHSGH